MAARTNRANIAAVENITVSDEAEATTAPAAATPPMSPTPGEPPRQFPVNRNFPIEYVSIVVGQKDKDGNVTETIHTIDGTEVQIVEHKLHIAQKHKQAKGPEGELIGFEPTGEETLNLQVKFIRNP
jgi:hypothetical protein